MHRTVLTVSFVLTACVLSLVAQTPPPAPASVPSPNASPNPGQQIHTDLNRLMRGVLYPLANVVFFPQADDPAKVPYVPGHDPSMSTDPITSVFGGWQAVENAALGLAESANLLTIPGRTCSNGVPVPVKDPTWEAFVQQVRDASMQAYKAAQTKDMDKMVEVAETVSASCSNCHRRFRDRRTPDNRCK
jgi:hypothetical protein